MIVERDSSIKLVGVWIDENLTLGGAGVGGGGGGGFIFIPFQNKIAKKY